MTSALVFSGDPGGLAPPVNEFHGSPLSTTPNPSVDAAEGRAGGTARSDVVVVDGLCRNPQHFFRQTFAPARRARRVRHEVKL